MKAADIMTTAVVCIRPDEPILQAAHLLLSERISALPVVDENERLVGIVSEGDLVRRAEIGTERPRTLAGNHAQLAADYLKAHGRKVSDVMSRLVVVAEEGTELPVIAGQMEKFNIKRLPVVRHGKVVGIVSRSNLLQGLISCRAKPVDTSVGDGDLRLEIQRKLDQESWSQALVRNIIVHQGHVELWGYAESAAQSDACRVAIESVPGVKSVESHLVVAPRGIYIW
jgi:CBS domain-containing protein